MAAECLTKISNARGTEQRTANQQLSPLLKLNEETTHLPESLEEEDLPSFDVPGCIVNGRNRCLEVPAAGIRDYLRALAGCLSVAVIDLPEAQVTVGLFKQGMVSRVRIDMGPLATFASKCDNQLLPISFHQHEKSNSLLPRGQLNTDNACDAENTGGHHDPGYACGSTGGSACKGLDIPPSSALRGTELFTGEYNCNPRIYARRPFACHAGDISGKLGTGVNVSPDLSRPDFRLMALDTHADNTCIASESKHSLVLHCHSTNFRIACAPFQRVETAGNRLPNLLWEIIRTASSAAPHLRNQNALLAALICVNEVEQRILLLEKAAKIRNWDRTPVREPDHPVSIG
ncbi:uncharacterized protein LOC34618852 [Cyclospora cayetanensis]|uniref:Uncharacterized protein LOC34618852 n=1 Tax=Cyclospora cayetanensis TaxID=88456 RepID=A0A6P6RYT5_9EIME|nr:uncharacterized protein LOC34618852 [Cyclospora cayetanensis]